METGNRIYPGRLAIVPTLLGALIEWKHKTTESLRNQD